MAVFKCKMCGGSLEITENSSVVTCEYCGTQQTLPKLNNEKTANLYDRADHFRRNNDFDKAIAVYEQILNEDNTDAEAYWSLVLCRYGVEYVEDPKDNKRIATVNRMQYTSVLADEDYKSAIKYAEPEQKAIYEIEAKEIDTIQKGILAISQREEPFDVFICYKETDNSGRRTPDSVLANELYHQLIGEGYKVFFSRITLEDKLGTAYEPYIFAALNSAKVMVVLGTKPDYFNAVWVRNEWSRFLALIKNGANKVLIPAYRDMDPYNLPEEFSHLQAQDMSKLGFMQDLIRGIKKIAEVDTPKTTVVKETVVTSENTNIAPLLKRAFMFLEDGEWQNADEYCEKVLDLDPENGEAYLGKMMVGLRVRRKEGLRELSESFENNPFYAKSLRFGDEKLKEELNGYLNEVRFGAQYHAAVVLAKTAKTVDDFVKVGKAFEKIKGYKDSEKLANEYFEKAEEAKKEGIYIAAVALMAGNKIANYKKALGEFEKIPNYKDAGQNIQRCNDKIAEIGAIASAAAAQKQQRDEARKEALQEKLPLIKKVAIIIVPLLIIAIVAVTVFPKIDWKGTMADDSSDMSSGTSTVVSDVSSEPTSSVESTSSNEEPSNTSKKPSSNTSKKPSSNTSLNNPTTPNANESVDYYGNTIKNGGEYTVEIQLQRSSSCLIDFSVENDAITINKISEGMNYNGALKLTIPDTIGKYPVVFIGKENVSYGYSVLNQIQSSGSESYISEIVLPGSVKEIRNCAFMNARINKINLPVGLEQIGSCAFDRCNLTEVIIPWTVTDLGNDAFSSNHYLKKITLNERIHKVPARLCYDCALETAIIPAANSVGTQAFAYCQSLVTVTSPSLKNIGSQAFSNCSSLKNIDVAENADIGDDAFFATPLEEKYTPDAPTLSESSTSY